MKLLYPFPEPLPLPKARGLQVAWMVDALARAGVDITLAHVPSSHNVSPMSPLAAFRGDSVMGIRSVSIERHWPFPFQRWHSVARFSSLLLRWLEQNPQDAIFVRHIKLADRLLRDRPDIPLVYEAHEVFAAGARGRKARILTDMESRVLSHASGIVSISKAVRDALHKRYTVHGAEIILHSGTHLPSFVSEKNWAQAHAHIIYAGSFFPWKGVDDLVKAAFSLPGYVLTLIGGETTDHERLLKMLSNSDAPRAKVVFIPRCDPEKISQYMDEACIAVLPNRADGVSQYTSPLKLFEYMGAGCAIVAADLPSIREVLPKDHPGWFIPGDSGDLARAIRRLAEDPSLLEVESKLMREAAHLYTWDNRAANLVRFIKNIVTSENNN